MTAMLNVKLLLSVPVSLAVLLLVLIAITPIPLYAATDCTAGTDVSLPECEALVALYNNTDGPNWSNHTGWLQDQTICDWFGVYCTDNHITWLELDNNNLTGSVPGEIRNLSSLNGLDLSNNKLMGIPAGIGNLTSLQYLYLTNDQLTKLPKKIGNLVNLKVLDLRFNQLTKLPASIGNLTSLEILRVHTNQLTELPPEIGKLSNLIDLRANNNQLTTIPPEIGNLSHLKLLILGTNPLTMIPSEIGNLSSLKQLSLDSNQLTSLPTTIINLKVSFIPIRYNRLPITGLDPALEAFLAYFDNQWKSYQTVPPDAVMLQTVTDKTVALSWTPIGDTTTNGYYEVGISTTGGDPYTFDPANRTLNKTATNITVSNLLPGTTYTFVVRAYRAAHVPDPVDVYTYSESTSVNSTEVSTTTTGEIPTEAPTEVPSPTPTDVAQGIELLINGGFEAKNGEGKPDLAPWVLKKPTKDKIKYNKPDKPVAFEGVCAFAFRGSTGEAATLQQVADLDTVTFAAGDSLDFSAFVKATNAAAAGKIKVVVKYSDADTGKINLTLANNTDYTELADSLDLASANITKIKLQIRHSSPAGKVYVDAVSLTLNPAGATSLGSRTIALP